MSGINQAAGEAKVAGPSEITIALQHPVDIKNAAGDVVEQLVEIKLRRLKGKDLRSIANAQSKGAGEAMAALVCASARIPPSTFDQLDAEDATELGIVAASFIGGALPTGAM